MSDAFPTHGPKRIIVRSIAGWDITAIKPPALSLVPVQ